MTEDCSYTIEVSEPTYSVDVTEETNNVSLDDTSVEVNLTEENYSSNVEEATYSIENSTTGVYYFTELSDVIPKSYNNQGDKFVKVNSTEDGLDFSFIEWGDITGTLSNQTDLQNALNSLVPYSGATTNVDLGEHEITLNGINLNTDYTISGNENVGSFHWNSEEGTSNLKLNNDVTLQLGQETTVLCKNQTGETIYNGIPVMFGGSVGNSGRLKIIKAIANGTYPNEYVLGLTTEDIENGGDGYVTSFGKVRGINTTGSPYGETWEDGDIIYISPFTSGYLTKVRPSAPNQIIPVAAVINAHTTGSLFVRPAWKGKLSDLSDINGTELNTTGQLVIWNNDNQYFDFTDNISNYTLNSNFTSHIEDSSIHFTQEEISITESQISDLQDYYLASNPDGFISDLSSFTTDNLEEGTSNLYLTGDEFQKNIDTMDNILNGTTYVKTHNDFTETDKTDISLNNTHRTSNGSDHSYINQDVTTASSPSFQDIKISNKIYLDYASNTYFKYNSVTQEVDLFVGGNIRASF